MFCKECLEDISPDCMLTNGRCVFCHYKIKEWESNGLIVKKKDAIVDYRNFFMSYVKYYKKTLKNIQSIYEKLPKGTFQKKYIRGHHYYYLAYRQGKKVNFEYIGKEISKELLKKIKKRKKLKKKILEIKHILFILREIKRPAISFNRYSILKRDNFTCQYCGRKAPNVVLEVDHTVPVSKGGTDDPSNLKAICFECNRQKHNK